MVDIDRLFFDRTSKDLCKNICGLQRDIGLRHSHFWDHFLAVYLENENIEFVNAPCVFLLNSPERRSDGGR